MKRLLTLLALVLCSCAETFVGEEIARPNSENLPDLTAAFAKEDNTRTYIEEGKYLRWNEDDRLTIFFGNTLNRQYKFNGATGDNSGTFSLVPDGMLGTGNAFDHIYALYPYNADVRITDEGIISLTLPAEQTYAENSFGRGANTMLAVTENVEDTFLAFKNACGYLKLKLYNAEGATIKSIEVKGNSGERLAGAATATIAFGEAPVLAMADDATTSVTLDCGEGVALGTTAETATEFWVVLPATTFAEGLTIIATDTEGGVFEKSTTNEVIIERNAIQPMAVLEAKFVATKPANNEIWYTNGRTTTATTPTHTDVFGASIVSNTYDAEKECWVIKFDGEVTEIGSYAFYGCSSLTSITIPESVTYIEGGAFVRCDNLNEFKGKFAEDGGRILVINDRLIAFAQAKLVEYNIPNNITSIGYEAFRECDNLTKIIIPNSVTIIDGHAFQNCDRLTSIIIPDSVISIGEYAFDYCETLSEVKLGNSVAFIGQLAFYGCGNLESIIIPESVSYIDYNAFCNCGKLKSFYFCSTTPPHTPDNYYLIFTYGDPEDLAINIYVYNESYETYISIWPQLESCIFNIGNKNEETTTIYYTTSNGNIATTDKLPIKSNEYTNGIGAMELSGLITALPDFAFSYCSNLTSITLPNSISTIGERAFYGCSSLKYVYMPNVVRLETWAFSNCSKLTSLVLPETLTSIDSNILYESGIKCVYCLAKFPPKLSLYINSFGSDYTIYVPHNSVALYKNADSWKDISDKIVGFNHECITTINYQTNDEKEVFACLPIISNIYNNNVGELIYYGEDTYIPEYAFYGCSSLTSVTIPDSVTTIGNCAFYGCSSLTSVTIPDSVTTIGGIAFYGCSSLTSVTIPDSVTTIGGSVFYNCSSLSSVTIPDSVTTIGGIVFYNCSSLSSVYCKAVTPPAGNSYMFDKNASGRKIYVPAEAVEAYKSAKYWSSYKNDIVGYDFEKGEVDTPEVTGGSYTVVLNNAWRESTSVSNPDSSSYDGVYESYSNYNIHNDVATMYIDIDGYSEFSIYVRSDAESSYDYVTVSELDSTTQKMSTSGKQNSGTAISNYTKVTYTGIDGGKHRITIIYKKDSSQHSGTDRGYLIIPKNQ